MEKKLDGKQKKEATEIFYGKFGDAGVDVLRNANGQNHYLKIAEDLGISKTRCSAILKFSGDLNISKKNKGGNYHKVAGVLGCMPKLKSSKKGVQEGSLSEVSKKRVSTAVKKASKTVYPSNISLPKNVSEMAVAYSWLYIVENVFRELVRKVYGKTEDWWSEKVVGKTIKDDVEESMEKYLYDAPKRTDELDYTTLQQLKEIITRSKNWDDFKPFLEEDNRKKFGLKFEIGFPLRNAVGHSILLNKRDLRSIEVKFGEILEMIKEQI